MATTKFKIIFAAKTGGSVVEVVEFNCTEPLTAVKGYVNEIVNGDGGSRGWVAAKVYPATEAALVSVGNEPAPHKCCGGKKCGKSEKSRLFNGYTAKEVADHRGWTAAAAKASKPESFATPESGWIDSVGWRSPFYLTVNFLHRDPITYMLGYDVYEAWEAWVDNGGSAGRFFNAHVKGNEQF